MATWNYGAIALLSSFAAELDIDSDSAPFWVGLSAGEIRVQRCHQCGSYRFPPGPYCLSCGSSELVYSALTSIPRLFSWIVVNRSTHPSMPVPYAVAVVEYDEGVRIPGAMAVASETNELAIGMPVRVSIRRGDRPFIAFQIGNPASADHTEYGVPLREGATWPAA